MSEDGTERAPQPNDRTGARHKRVLIDAAWAILLAYAVAQIFAFSTKGIGVWQAGNTLFLFVLAFLFPWVAIAADPIGILYIFLFGLLFYGVVRYSPSRVRPLTLAAALLGWEVYGLYCVSLVAP